MTVLTVMRLTRNIFTELLSQFIPQEMDKRTKAPLKLMCSLFNLDYAMKLLAVNRMSLSNQSVLQGHFK